MFELIKSKKKKYIYIWYSCYQRFNSFPQRNSDLSCVFSRESS